MTSRQTWLAAALLLITIGLIITFVIPAWLWHPLGVCAGAPTQVRDCKGYNLWSGIAGSCVTGSGIWTGAITMWWHRTCHAPGCLRLARHPTADSTHVLCGRHHPDIPAGGRTLEQIHAAHHAAKEST